MTSGTKDGAEPAEERSSDDEKSRTGETCMVGAGNINKEALDDIELTDRAARQGNPVALIFNMMKDGKPHPHPAHWDFSDDRLLAAYVFQTDSPPKQRKRLWEERKQTPGKTVSPGVG